MTEGKSRSARLKELIRAPKLLVMHAVYDGFTVRLLEKLGYQAAFVSGAALSESNLGRPDIGLMGLEENLTACRRLASCCNLALLADCDTGYGNALNVFHMVRQMEEAGVAGIMIEDQVWPKRCGHMAGKAVVSAEEHAEKIAAAREARRDPDFVIKARTDAFGTHGLDEAIRRLNLYAEAGADLLFADALASEEDIRHVARSVPGPLCVNMGFGLRTRSTTPLISVRRLEAAGVAVAMYGRMLSASAIQGLKNALAAFEKSLDEEFVTERPELLVSFDELNELMGLPDLRSLEQKFARATRV